MIRHDMAGLFKPPCARHVENLPFERDSSQYPVESALAVGGDQHKAISEVVSVPHFFYELLTYRKVRLGEAVSELLPYSVSVALWGVDSSHHSCFLHKTRGLYEAPF